MEEYMKKLEGQDDSIDEEDIDDDINLNPLSKKIYHLIYFISIDD